MKAINSLKEDYHIHSLNFSDGMNTIDEIVLFAGSIGLEKIAITDHSQAALSAWRTITNRRQNLPRRHNIHNNIDVIFGVEGDLLDEEGNCCFDIQEMEGAFCTLSVHQGVFKGDLKNITQAYTRAIEKYHDKITFICHPCVSGEVSAHLDSEKLAEVLNRYNVPLELNCSYLLQDRRDHEKFAKLATNTKAGIFVNSDAHTLYDLTTRSQGFAYLETIRIS